MHKITLHRGAWATAAFEIQIRTPFRISAAQWPRGPAPPLLAQGTCYSQLPGAEIKIHFRRDLLRTGGLGVRTLGEMGGVWGTLGEGTPEVPAM